MATTFLNLKERLERWIIDNNAQLTTETAALVNKGHRELQKRHNFRTMEIKTSAEQLVTTNITRTVGVLPDDWKEKRANPYYVDVSGNTIPIEWAPSEEEMVKQFDDNTTTDKGTPRFILETNTGFDVFPFPDDLSDHGDGNWRIIVPYYKFLDVLSADGDNDFLTNNLEWSLIAHSLAWGFLLNWDEQRAAVWTQLAENEMTRDIKHEKSKKFKRSGIMKPRRDVNANFNARGW